MRSKGVQRLSSVGARVPSPSYLECWAPLKMGTVGAAYYLTTALGNIFEIMVKNSDTRQVNRARHCQRQ